MLAILFITASHLLGVCCFRFGGDFGDFKPRDLLALLLPDLHDFGEAIEEFEETEPRKVSTVQSDDSEACGRGDVDF